MHSYAYSQHTAYGFNDLDIKYYFVFMACAVPALSSDRHQLDKRREEKKEKSKKRLSLFSFRKCEKLKSCWSCFLEVSCSTRPFRKHFKAQEGNPSSPVLGITSNNFSHPHRKVSVIIACWIQRLLSQDPICSVAPFLLQIPPQRSF